jgi:hypothetical protein
MSVEMTDDKQQTVFVLLVHQWADKSLYYHEQVTSEIINLHNSVVMIFSSVYFV